MRLVYLLAVLVLVWPAMRVIRGRGNALLSAAIWLGALTALVAGYVLWRA